MSDNRAKELLDLGNKLFVQKEPILSLWQTIADNFYPERGDFLDVHYLGEEFVDDIMDSHPLLMRRELGNQVSAMLRPRDRQWFQTTTLDEDRDTDENNAKYLEYVTKTIYREIYNPHTKFIRATKTGDHDFVTFGQCVISVEEAPGGRNHLYFRAHHLRDCTWMDNEVGEIDTLHRKDKMSARQLQRTFGEKNLSGTVKSALKKNPGAETNVRCIVMPADDYDYIGPDSKKKGRKLPFVVIYIDADSGKILKEGGLADFIYCVPRWHMVSNWTYAFSPCTVISLPDARMAQAMGQIILEAGEKAIDPPVVAVEEAVREVNLQAGKITWADLAFDNKLQDVVRPIPLDLDMRTGFAMREDLRQMLAKAWFIDKLNLPPAEGKMTAFETARRLEEFIRNLMPLFEPMEVEYNARVLDMSFNTLRNMGRFPDEEVPDDLAGADVSWTFENTLQDTQKRAKVEQFTEGLQLVAAGLEGGATANPIDVDIALKDALVGLSSPATWRKPVEVMAAEREQKEADQSVAKIMAELQGGSEVAGNVADAAGKLKALDQPANPGNVVPFQKNKAA